jgi:hypothetical protein
MAVEIKTIGASGQISLGKQHAGRTVTVEEVEEGVWIVRSAVVIPENELWLHEAGTKARVDKAIAWSLKNRASETNLAEMEKKLSKRR